MTGPTHEFPFYHLKNALHRWPDDIRVIDVDSLAVGW